jgi:hypothetical protein
LQGGVSGFVSHWWQALSVTPLLFVVTGAVSAAGLFGATRRL